MSSENCSINADLKKTTRSTRAGRLGNRECLYPV
jgi:hypothetical protein